MIHLLECCRRFNFIFHLSQEPFLSKSYRFHFMVGWSGTILQLPCRKILSFWWLLFHFPWMMIAFDFRLLKSWFWNELWWKVSGKCWKQMSFFAHFLKCVSFSKYNHERPLRRKTQVPAWSFFSLDKELIWSLSKTKQFFVLVFENFYSFKSL